MGISAPAGPVQTPQPRRFSVPAGSGGISGLQLTDEQVDIVDAFHAGGTVVVEALAGTGKTTTLRALAAIADRERRPGLYLAYNKAIQKEAEVRFPGTVLASTAHALAYGSVGRQYAHRLPGRGRGARRLYARDIVKMFDVKPAAVVSATISPVQLVRLAEATVNRFCISGDYQIGPQHLPARAEHLGPVDALAAAILPVAEQVWGDIIDPHGRLYFHHDHYLKMWQLLRPTLPYSYLMFDEAQDANPVIAEVVARQHSTQLIYVGDRNQQLYAWRGAVDAMQSLDGVRLPLTKSFRFGPRIAEEANRWLELLGSPHMVRGHDPIDSRVGPIDGAPDAILCRTNGTALGHILAAQERGIRVAMAPGERDSGKDLRNFAYAARDLMAGKGTDHPELVTFKNWPELLQYVEEEEGGADLERLVKIINRIGPNGVITAVNRLVPKEQAELTVSTGHKAKGLEWDRVKVADDFTPPDPDEQAPVDPAALMLNYVTVTRAKRHLDPGPLNPLDWM